MSELHQSKVAPKEIKLNNHCSRTPELPLAFAACELTFFSALTAMLWLIFSKHAQPRLPYVVWSSSTVQEHIFGRLKILGPVWCRCLGPADEFAGARTGAILLSILVEVYKLVQGSKGHRSETETVEMPSSVNTVLQLFASSVSNWIQQSYFGETATWSVNKGVPSPPPPQRTK
jgi:uncharacterized protein (DUF2236 family)